MARKAMIVLGWPCGPMAHDPTWDLTLPGQAHLPSSPFAQAARRHGRPDALPSYGRAMDPCRAAVMDLDEGEVEEDLSTLASSPVGGPTLGREGMPSLIRTGSDPGCSPSTVRIPLRC